MPYASTRYAGIRRVASAGFALLALGGLAAAGYGGYLLYALRSLDPIWWLAGGLSAVLLSTLLYAQFLLLHKLANQDFRNYEALLDMVDLLRRQGDYARSVAENSALSDWSKRIVYREKDYEFLRDTIQGCIVRQDWESAEHLIETLEEELGFKAEAERLRGDVAQARQATTEERVAAAINRFEALCGAQKWEQAEREVKRLQTLFPGQPRIARLGEEIAQRRERYKRYLLQEYDQAIRIHDVDGAHRLLFELDRYLSPNEAAALKESARGVFKAKLLQAGVQFSLAVSDRQWAKAIEIGAEVIHEFPNSRYAQEIQAMMPALQRRVREGGSLHAPAGTA